MLYWSYTEGRGSILHRLQKQHEQNLTSRYQKLAEREVGSGNSTREKEREGRDVTVLTRPPNNLTLENNIQVFHAQCILNRLRGEPFTINICIFREPTYIKKNRKTKTIFSLLFFPSCFSSNSSPLSRESSIRFVPSREVRRGEGGERSHQAPPRPPSPSPTSIHLA